MKGYRRKRITAFLASVYLAVCMLLCSGCGSGGSLFGVSTKIKADKAAEGTDAEDPLPQFDLSEVPAWSGKPSCDINGDVPFFADDELTTETFESYSDLDELGRCGVAYACVGPETLPTEERESISDVKPTGWHSVRYDGIDGEYLYNRCHLIGFQLTGQNANEKNLITGTRYMNVQGMEEFERSVAMYIETTGYHVLYRVTPVFEGDNLVASGVLMEAKSVEDQEIQYCAYCYNVQPGVTIDYATGESTGSKHTEDGGEENPDVQSGEDAFGAGTAPADNSADSSQTGTDSGDVSDSGGTSFPEDASKENEGSAASFPDYEEPNQDANYIVNTNTGTFHLPTCASAKKTKPKNRMDWFGTREELIEQGYKPCALCSP